MHKFIAVGIFLLARFPAEARASDAELTVRFPAVSTILESSELGKVEAVANENKATDRCFVIKGYFSPEKSQWTYRIVGRSRVLEVYRILVNQGVNPQTIQIRSLGPLNETREYRAKPLGQEVKLLSVSAEHPDCVQSQNVTASQVNAEAVANIHLDYEVLDADPAQASRSMFLNQVRAHKDLGSEMLIETYSDMTGSRYLNRVLSRLRALVLMRQATQEGYPADRIKLRWNGSVQSHETGLPEPVVEVQRRSVVRFVMPEKPETESSTAGAAQGVPAEVPAEPTAPAAEGVLAEEGKEAEPSVPRAWEFAGFLALGTGPSSLKSHVGIGKGFGLRAAYLLAAPEQGLRYGMDLQISRDAYQPKSSLLDGGHTIDALTLSGLWLNVWDLPLSMRAGLRYEMWSGEVTHKKLLETRKFSGRDIAPYAALGYRFGTFDRQWLEPRIEWDQGSGDLRGAGFKAILEYGITRGVQ
jgi:outer membrane protein OmpA-like peptidoglycan-associated protein